MSTETAPRAASRFQILLCEGPSCGLTHESDRFEALLRAKIAGDDDLRRRVHVVVYNCFGRCSEGPNMFVRPLAPGEDGDEEPRDFGGRGFYPGVDEAKALRVLDEHCGRGRPVEGLVDEY